MLVQELRETLGDNYVISLAAGGFNEFLEESIERKNDTRGFEIYWDSIAQAPYGYNTDKVKSENGQ